MTKISSVVLWMKARVKHEANVNEMTAQGGKYRKMALKQAKFVAADLSQPLPVDKY